MNNKSLRRLLKFQTIIKCLLIIGILYFSIFNINRSVFSSDYVSYFSYEKDSRNTSKNTLVLENRIPKLLLDDIVNSPLIFIGGYARSGTTLMRAILDVHPAVSCGPETKVLPAILEFTNKYLKMRNFMNDLESAHLGTKTVDQATALYIYYILQNHIENTERLCAKDPNLLYNIAYLHQLFPSAKFIYMVRDGRDVVYSLMTKINEPLIDKKIKSYLSTWNSYNRVVSEECFKLRDNCMVVRYEDLVMDNQRTIRQVAGFLGLKWIDEFLEHEKYVGGKVVVSDTEWSTGQIKKPLYNTSINGWIGHINYSEYHMKLIDRMLTMFGYKR